MVTVDLVNLFNVNPLIILKHHGPLDHARPLNLT